MPSYSPAEIEARWQAAWEKNDVFQAVRNADKPKYLLLFQPFLKFQLHTILLEILNFQRTCKDLGML